MFDSIENNFFFEKTSRQIDEITDIEELKELTKEILSLYVKQKEVYTKVIKAY